MEQYYSCVNLYNVARVDFRSDNTSSACTLLNNAIDGLLICILEANGVTWDSGDTLVMLIDRLKNSNIRDASIDKIASKASLYDKWEDAENKERFSARRRDIEEAIENGAKLAEYVTNLLFDKGFIKDKIKWWK